MITIEDLRHGPLGISTLEIRPGTTTVIGRNGSGKTTLLRLLAGILVPDSGTILVDGIPPRETGIGWVNEFPDRNISFWNVSEEIAAPLRFRHLPCPVIEETVGSWMQTLGIADLADRPVRQLSGGEKVLVALASALVIRPQVLVLDEYDSHLDAGCARACSRIIRESRTRYVIHCTQDMDAAAAADSVIVLDRGTLAVAGEPGEVFPSLRDTPFFPHSWRCRD